MPDPYDGTLTKEMGALKFFGSCVVIEKESNCFREATVQLQKLADARFWDRIFQTCNSYKAVLKTFTNLYTDETRIDNPMHGKFLPIATDENQKRRIVILHNVSSSPSDSKLMHWIENKINAFFFLYIRK